MKFAHFILVGISVSLLLWIKDSVGQRKRSKEVSHAERPVVDYGDDNYPIYDIRAKEYVVHRKVETLHPFNNATLYYYRPVPVNFTEDEFYTVKQDRLLKPKCPEGWKPFEDSNLLFHDEFGIELILMVSYAHWLHMHCYDIHTTSSLGTDPLYYFSNTHTIVDVPRQSIPDNYSCCPLKSIHVKELPKKFWSPQYKQVYSNNLLVFDKPMLIISNKFQKEWDKRPVNFLTTGVIVTLLELLTPHYVVVYNRPTGDIVRDASESYDLSEKEAVKQHGAILFEDLHESTENKLHTEIPFNIFQMWVYANAVNYIAVQGGNSIYASHLAGEDAKVTVYLKQGRELTVDSMNKWYGRFSGANVTSFNSPEVLIDYVSKSYIPAPAYTPRENRIRLDND